MLWQRTKPGQLGLKRDSAVGMMMWMISVVYLDALYMHVYLFVCLSAWAPRYGFTIVWSCRTIMGCFIVINDIPLKQVQ